MCLEKMCRDKKSFFGKSKLKKVLIVLFMVGVFISTSALFSFLVMLLWNAVIPDVFGLTVINFWQSAGILILSRVFFGNFHHKKRDKFWAKFYREKGGDESTHLDKDGIKQDLKDHIRRKFQSTDNT